MSARDIFGSPAGAYALYRVECQVRHQLCGGIPKDPAMIKAWLMARLKMKEAAIIELADETQAQMMEANGTRPSADELLDELASRSKGNGFKSIDGQLVFEGRCVKGGLKEFASIAYPGTTPWPGRPEKTRKGLKSYIEERVFVDELFIPLGVVKPDVEGETRVKHVSTPQGKRSTLAVVDLVHKPLLSFTVRVLDDCLPDEVWGRIWEIGEENGFGADRARDDGKFDLARWEKLEDTKPAKGRRSKAA